MIYIFFDTNILENRFNNDCLTVSQPSFSKIYYDTKSFILDNNIETSVKICIPEIVFFEIKKHLVECYKSKSDALKDHVNTFKKIFGDLIDITVNKNICHTKEEYIDYINGYFEEILDTNSNILSIIPYPRDIDTFENIIMKALHSEKPFTKVKSNGKEYTDAGFKDAIIYETLLKCANDNFCILISKDKDFKNLIDDKTENIQICEDEKSLKEILLSKVEITDNKYKINKILSENDYFIKTLLAEINFDENANYKLKEIFNIEETELGTDIKFSAIINGEEYKFDIIFEINANELVEVINFGENNEH